MHIISHISRNLSLDETNLFLKALNKKGSEATAYIWIQWWFDYKNDKRNNIKEDYKNWIIDAIEKNKNRIYKASLGDNIPIKKKPKFINTSH